MIHNPSTQRRKQALARVEERSPKNRMLTFTLACLGGFWGLHRFYTGRFWTGLAMLFTGGGFIIWWILDVFILLSGRFKDGEGRVLGPPRRAKRKPAGHLPDRRSKKSAPEPKEDADDDIPLDELLEDPLECEFEKLEREMSTDGTVTRN